MKNRKSLLAVALATLFAFFGTFGSAGATASPTASATQVLDLIVDVSGATTERGMTPSAASVDRDSLRITAASCEGDSDWLSYYMGPARVGSNLKGVVGGTLCNGDKVFRTDPDYLPDTYKVWKLMAEVTDQAFNRNNKYLYGLYLGSVGKSVHSNGEVATLSFARPHGSGRAYPSIKRVKIVGSKSRYIWVFHPQR